MSTFLNYFIEANLGLIFFAVVYKLCLRNENQFAFNRFYLLMAIAVSVLFPLLHVHMPSGGNVLPSVGRMLPAYWLPEILIGAEGRPAGVTDVSQPFVLLAIEWTYFTVAGALTLLFVFRLAEVVRLASTSGKYRWKNCVVAESDADKPTFSFFRFIFIGQSSQLTVAEKEEILRHEWVHVHKVHSLDVVLLQVLQIIFWINPLVVMYKNVFVRLHEFEADARSVENRNMDEYCQLLAKVSLRSAGLSLVNHFNYSLTLKRISMMKTTKKKIQGWKLAVLVAAVPALFLAVACQEQVVTDLQNVNKNSATITILPSEVATQLEQLKRDNPGKEYIVIQLNDEGKTTLDNLMGTKRDANSNEADGRLGNVQLDYAPQDMRTSPKADGPVGGQFAKVQLDDAMHVVHTSPNSDGRGMSYVILAKTMVARVNYALKADSIRSFAEVAPQFNGGMEALVAYMQKELKYPEQAKKDGLEGKVFVSFVVTKDGSVVSPTVMKGLSEECNAEALRVVSGFPKWIPGQDGGEKVNVKFILPINFQLSPGKSKG